MRILEPFNKRGKFWLPEKSNQSLTGMLSVSEKGLINLELEGELEFILNTWKENSEPKRIYGITYDGKKVTLEECFCYHTTFNTVGGVIKYQVQLMLENVCLNENQELKISKLALQFDNMSNWLRLTGFKGGKFDDKDMIVEWKSPEPYLITINNNINLSFKLLPQQSGTFNEIRMLQKPYLELTFKDDISIDEASEYANKLVKFFCFATDDALSLTSLSVFSDKIIDEDYQKPSQINIYAQSTTYVDKISEKPWHKMFFSFSDVKNNLQNILNKWFESYGVFPEALDLYFAVLTGAYHYADSKFLALAQALEAFHRRTCPDTKYSKSECKQITKSILENCPAEHKKMLREALAHANELSLHQRLDKLITPFEILCDADNKIWLENKDNLIKKIKDTRNYMSHYYNDKKAVKGVDIHYLQEKIKGILQLNLLKYLGFSMNEIQIMYNNYDKLKYRLNNFE